MIRSASLAGWLIFAGLALPLTTHAQVNSWTNSSGGKWEDATAWDGGLPGSSTAALITNALSKTVAIDATTVSSAPGSLTISNLLLSAPGVATNTLSLSNAGATPLRVQFALTNAVGGALFITNSTVYVNVPTGGPLAVRTNVLDGLTTISAGGAYVGTNAMTILGSTNAASGRVDIRGGTMMCGDLVIAGATNAAGRVGIVQGLLTATNITLTVGRFGPGELTVSNGTVRSGALAFTVGAGSGGSGTLTLVNSTNILSSSFFIASAPGSTGAVWVTAGSVVTNTIGISIGFGGNGTLNVSNSAVFVRGLTLGSASASAGTATFVGSSITSDATLTIGLSARTTGTVTVVGGQLDAITNAFTVAQGGVGSLTASNCTIRGGNFKVGSSGSGTLTLLSANTTVLGNAFIGVYGTGVVWVTGGTASVFSNLVVGDCVSNSVGQVTLASGVLAVTNAGHTAVLDVRSGTLTVGAGTLVADKIVMTNACGRFIHTGGTLIYDSAMLDPNLSAVGDGIPNGWKQLYGLDPFDPNLGSEDADGDGMSNLQEYLAGTDPTNSASLLHVTSVVRTNNNDLFISWMTGIGKTNGLQAAAGDVNGGYSTNTFTDLFIVTNTVGTVTTYLHVGGVTNTPARYYRVRLVP